MLAPRRILRDRVRQRRIGSSCRSSLDDRTEGGSALNLSRTRDVTTDDVEDICHLRDDAYRNRWITYAYWNISQRLGRWIGNNATWCTFSTWSSRTIGENLRLDKATRRIEELIYDEQTSISPRDNPWLLRLQYRVSTRDNGAAQLALARGNRLIFHEIGYSVIQLVDWIEKNPGFNLGAWQAYRRNNLTAHPPDELFPAANEVDLWTGLDCYYRAAHEQDEKVQAELVLHGNVLLGAYEQERADPMLKIALEPFPGRYVEVVKPDPNEPATLSLPSGTTPWALHASLLRLASEQFGALMTRYVMALDAPLFTWSIRPLRLGRAIPAPAAGASLFPPMLEELHDDKLSELIGTHDKSRGSRKRCAAGNWTQFPDRMNYIVNLFRAGQQDKNLYRELPQADLRTLDLDLSDDHLDDLRKFGDDEIDPLIAEHVTRKGVDPRKYVEGLIKEGFADLRAAVPVTPPLPAWADKAKLWAGQEFFRRYGLEIGAALFSASLPISYTAARGAHVLTTTGALVSTPRRRLAETGQMLLDAMASSDPSKPPLDPDTLAYEAARGVRLFHGAVRHMILNDPEAEWQKQAPDVPINQEDLVGTLTVFTVAVVASLDQMGVTCTAQDRDAYLHLWLVIGELLGIDYKLLFREERPGDEQPLTYADMQLLARVILKRNAEPSPGGKRLMGALLGVSRDSMPPPLKGLPRAMTRQLIGNEHADMLGVPPAGMARLWTAGMRPLNAMISPYVRRNLLGSLTTMLTKRLYEQWVNESRGHRAVWRLQKPWSDPATTRIRRGASAAVLRLPVISQPTKERISGLVSPD
jgi:ER-bound oxygenase mpaB/B'/Rubber oxygenase, catalytic domain